MNTLSAAKVKDFSTSQTGKAAYKRFKATSDQPKSTKTEAHHKRNLKKLRKTVELCLIPGHAYIPGNEITDKKKPKKHQEGKKNW